VSVYVVTSIKKNNFEKTHKKIDDEEELKGGG
jgi:hypothetical protein